MKKFDVNAALDGSPVVMVAFDDGKTYAVKNVRPDCTDQIKLDTDWSASRNLYADYSGDVYHIGQLFMDTPKKSWLRTLWEYLTNTGE